MSEEVAREGTLVFAGDRPAATLSDAVRRGDLRRLARGIYTTDLVRPGDQIVREQWAAVAARRFPGSVVTDRSAPRAGPVDGVLYLSGPRGAMAELPGLTIVSRKGPGPASGDIELPVPVALASRARGLLDNTRSSRQGRRHPRATLGPAELADWVDHLFAMDGVEAMVRLRADVQALVTELGVDGERARRVDELIGAALGTREAPSGAGALAARARGLPYDQDRVARFDVLIRGLLDRPTANVSALRAHAARRRALPFFEAYFSNFIEGTEFTPAEAEEIVVSGVTSATRPADGHAVLGTFRLLADEEALARQPSTGAEALDRLKGWNAAIMAARPEQRPGEWKQRANRAGGPEFVAPDLVVGTLAQGWERMARLHTPFQRAVFTLFMVSEVHPFSDGNGRTARVAMAAELVAGEQSRVIVPTICRLDYLNGLRRLTRQDRPDLLIDVLDRLQRFTAAIDFTDTTTAREQLATANAFVDAVEAERSGLHLRMP
ncbi:MAG: Fic family protein [Iamia sp.]